MTRTLTVAALQSAYGMDLAANIGRTAELVREAAGLGAQVILPSELFQGPYFCVAQEERWFATAHPWREHPCVTAMADLAARFRALPPGCQDAEAIQNEVYAAGKDAGFEPLRAWFTALYEVLLGQSQGPRFGSFAAIFGLDRTIALIERALAGDDLAE